MSRWEAEALLARVDQDRSDHHGSTDERRSDETRATEYCGIGLSLERTAVKN
jgi:hypothetical protein